MDVEEGNRIKQERKRHNQTANSQSSKWKTAREHVNYSTKLLEALHYVAGRSSKSPSSLRGRIVREAADRVLAAAARGRTKWSRAILSNSYALRLRRRRRIISSEGNFTKVFKLNGAIHGLNRSPRHRRGCSMIRKKAPAMDRKLKVLARLVPGGRKLSFPLLLEEASDYISALEMQVRAMKTLAKVLSSVGSSPAPAPSTSSSPPREA